jgi:hypothetical protein
MLAPDPESMNPESGIRIRNTEDKYTKQKRVVIHVMGGGGLECGKVPDKPISQLAVSLRNIIHYTGGRKGQSDRSAVGRRAKRSISKSCYILRRKFDRLILINIFCANRQKKDRTFQTPWIP